MIRYGVCALFLILNVNHAVAESKARIDSARGAMLYDNHCLLCHTRQIHWREKKIASNWISLIEQVDRWRRNSGLEWSQQDIEEVSRYLNAKYYHYATDSK